MTTELILKFLLKCAHKNTCLSSADMSTPIPPGGEILDFNKCPNVFNISFKVQHPVSIYLQEKLVHNCN